MESLREFYKIGNGPSSSHTMGPEKAAKEFRKIIENEYGIISSTRWNYMEVLQQQERDI